MTRKQRYEWMRDYFREKMPEVQTELEFGSEFQLLVAVMLSAQCTDKRINQVTPELFRRFPDARSMAQVEADEAILGQKLQYYRDWITHTDYTDPYWNTGVWADLKSASRAVSVPVTIVAGQFDHHEEGTLLGFERLPEEVRAHSRLILGAWNHSFQPTPTHVPHEHARDFNTTSDQFEWFYRILVRKETPQQEILAYAIERDEWLKLDSWPLKTKKYKDLYLSAKQKGDKWNILSLTDRKARKAKVGYTYDPDDPVYAVGGETLFTSSQRRGSRVQPEAGWRDDVLSFVSEPLTEDLTIAGEVKVRLEVSSDVDDTAFAFTLSEVTPDGAAYNMRTSITTLGYRKDLLGKRQAYRRGKKVRIEIVALPVVWTVRAGNSLRLDVKSSNFPEYAVHPNKAGVWAEQADAEIAHQTIYTGSRRTVLRLPVTK